MKVHPQVFCIFHFLLTSAKSSCFHRRKLRERAISMIETAPLKVKAPSGSLNPYHCPSSMNREFHPSSSFHSINPAFSSTFSIHNSRSFLSVFDLRLTPILISRNSHRQARTYSLLSTQLTKSVTIQSSNRDVQIRHTIWKIRSHWNHQRIYHHRNPPPQFYAHAIDSPQ
jgi:hypothetical protein